MTLRCDRAATLGASVTRVCEVAVGLGCAYSRGMNNNEITDEQIEQLQIEAAKAGDGEMVGICLRALDHHGYEADRDYTIEEARAECARVIATAHDGVARSEACHVCGEYGYHAAGCSEIDA